MEDADFAYVRLSQDREGGGVGVDNQLDDIRKAAALAGRTLDPDGLYVDDDRSASGSKPREEYQRLLADIRAGRWRHGWVWHTDRLHRKPRELEDYIDACDPHGVITRTVKAGHFDLSTPAGRAVARTLCAWARYEVEHKADRQRTANEAAAGRGELWVSSNRPYGWAPDQLHLDEAEHAVIVEIAGRLLVGEAAGSVAADLNRREVPTRRGASWSRTVIRQMMVSPRMAGYRAYKGREVARGPQYPALDEDTWRQLCALFTDRTRPAGANARKYLLTSIATCVDCQTPVTVRCGGQKRPAYSRNSYRCPTCGGCALQAPTDAVVHGRIVAYLEGLPPSAARPPKRNSDAASKIEELQHRIEDATAEFAADPDVTPAQLRAITRSLREQITELEAQATPARRRQMLSGMTGSKAADAWTGAGLDRQRAICAELFDIRLRRFAGGRRRFDPSRVVIEPRE